MKSGMPWYKLLLACVSASLFSGCATDQKVYLVTHRQEGTRQDFDLSPQELKDVVVSLDGQGDYSVKPREGEGGSLDVTARSGAFDCIVDAVPPKFAGANRAGLKVICASELVERAFVENVVLGSITKVAAARTTRLPAPATAQNPETARQPIVSDVDAPKYHQDENADRFAVVVGIEKYQNLPKANFADRDAAAVRAHLLALGVPQRNIFFATDNEATRAGLVKAVHTWLPNRINGNSTVYFYYSGHGAPDPKSREAYLVPIDGDPEALADTAYPLKSLYQHLGQLKAKQVIVALDSCFSGAGGRSVLPGGTRPLVTMIDKPTAADNTITLSASKSDQISGTMDDQGHGTFTYYLLKGLNDGGITQDGSVTVQTLYNYLKLKVADAARLHNRDQTPELNVGASLSSDLKLR